MRKLMLLVALLSAVSLSAQTNDLGLWYSRATVDTTSDDDAAIEFDDGDGLGISFNHHFTPSLSVEVAATRVSHSGALLIPDFAFDLGDLEMTALTAVLQLHFGHGRIRPYVGAGAAYVMADDLDTVELLDLDTIEIDSEVGWLVNGGVSFNLTPRLALSLDAKYIPYAPESIANGDEATSQELELNPLIVSAGVRIRF